VLRTTPMLLSALLISGAETLAAQAGTTLPPSPTLPSDTLEANYAPRSAPGPMPQLAPALPSDTLEATQPELAPMLPRDTVEAAPPADSVPTDSSGDDDQGLPQTPGDSAALRELRSWIQRHPGLISPPPVRAMLVRV
jgi:hypothetical protein